MSAVWLTADGVGLETLADDVLDLLVDGRRVWSFRPRETAVATSAGHLVEWPRDLGSYLDGTATFAVRDSSGVLLAQDELGFGDGASGASAARIAVVDESGHDLVIGTNGRLVRTFETRTAEQLVPLIDALEVVVRALAAHGVAAFPAYGTLLGAVREGRVIGHDDDADVGYVSRCTHPADVVIESFRLQRSLQAEGFRIVRYSGGAFKVEVGHETGAPIGLDVFAGFFHEGNLALMGEIYQPFETSWIFPLGEVELEGRRLPAPARPEKLLEAMYGPSWQVPDPTFRFETPQSVHDLFNGWFRGTRTYRNLWDRRYSTSTAHGPLNSDPHKIARVLKREEAPGSLVVDLGCGRGQDAVWLAKKGFRVVGLDYSANGYAFFDHLAQERDWALEFHEMTLLEQRHVVAWGAELAMRPGPRAVLARHLLDATTPRGRDGLWRLCRMLLGREGGRLYLEFMSLDPARDVRAMPEGLEYPDGLIREVDPDVVAEEARAVGAVVLRRRAMTPVEWELPSPPAAGSPVPQSCRMVLQW